MMALSYLDKTGLSTLWNNIKGFFVKGNGKVFVGTCYSEDIDNPKTVTCSSFTSSDLVRGTVIYVYFSNDNRISSSSLQLEVNNTAIKHIKYMINGEKTDLPSPSYIKSGNIYQFTYDGTYWIISVYENLNTEAYNILPKQTIGVLYNKLNLYSIIFTRNDGTLLSTYGGAATQDATKTLTTTSFNPFGNIYYYIGNSDVSANNSPDKSKTYIQYFSANLSYSFNTGTSSSALEAKNPVYVRCNYSNGSAILDGNDCITQTLPSTEDNKIYILLGYSYSGYPSIVLFNTHPVYIYKNGAVRVMTDYATYAGSASSADNATTVNSHTVLSDVPANAVFTDTVTTVSISGNGNAVTSITASNGALTVTKGSTFLTAHQNAFSNVKVGNTTIVANAKTDTLELVAGTNVTLTPDATNDKVTIAVTLPIWDGTVT